MLKQRRAAVDLVAAAINPAEVAVDMASIEISRTVTAILEARQMANLPLSTALDPLRKVSRALELAIASRQELIEAHPLLDQAARGIGIDLRAYGKDVPPMASGECDHLIALSAA